MRLERHGVCRADCPPSCRPEKHIHFLGRCVHCDALAVSRMTLEQVDYWRSLGVLSDAQREGFYAVWVAGAFRFGVWPPARRSPAADSFAELVRDALALTAT